MKKLTYKTVAFTLLLSMLFVCGCADATKSWTVVNLENCGTLKLPESWTIKQSDGRYYIFDAAIPTLIDGEISPIVAEITEEIFNELIPVRNRNGISVEVSHYNPLRFEDVTIIYDSGRDMKFDVTKKEIISKNK